MAESREYIDTPDGRVVAWKDDVSLAGAISTDGPYVPIEAAVLSSLVEPGSTAIDVGANCGFLTLRLSRAVGTAGRVVAFEPVAKNRALLLETVASNGLCNVSVDERALGMNTGHDTIFLSSTNHGRHSLIESNVPNANDSAPIVMTRLDDIVHEYGATDVRLIKIDVEGFEASVLAGARQVLALDNVVFWIEVWAEGLIAASSSVADILTPLSAAGYEIAVFDDLALRITSYDDALGLLYDPSLPRNINYVLASRSRRDLERAVAAATGVGAYAWR